jgi:competence protein ComFC
MYIRGFNQSEYISKGLSEALNKPVITDLLLRAIHSESQTKQSRFARWENVSSAFNVQDGFESLKHIALVDDVVTTGSTLESCVKIIQEKYPRIKISILSLAKA